MGLFSKKVKQPMPVGQALCIVDADGRAFVNQQHHQSMGPDTIAMLAAITWVIDGAATILQGRGHGPMRAWVQGAHEAAMQGSVEYNRQVNPGGVSPIADPGAGMPHGTGVMGAFAVSHESLLTGSWQAIEGYDGDAHMARVLGVLLAAADWRDVGDNLSHAFEALTQDAIDFHNTLAHTHLPQTALDYGVHQGALGRLHNQRPWDD